MQMCERVMKQDLTMAPLSLLHPLSLPFSLSPDSDCCINRGVRSCRYHKVKFRQFVSTQSKAVLWPIFGGPFGGLTIRFHIIYGGTVTYGLFITVRPLSLSLSLSLFFSHTHLHTDFAFLLFKVSQFLLFVYSRKYSS